MDLKIPQPLRAGHDQESQLQAVRDLICGEVGVTRYDQRIDHEDCADTYLLDRADPGD